MHKNIGAQVSGHILSGFPAICGILPKTSADAIVYRVDDTFSRKGESRHAKEAIKTARPPGLAQRGCRRCRNHCPAHRRVRTSVLVRLDEVWPIRGDRRFECHDDRSPGHPRLARSEGDSCEIVKRQLRSRGALTPSSSLRGAHVNRLITRTLSKPFRPGTSSVYRMSTSASTPAARMRASLYRNDTCDIQLLRVRQVGSRRQDQRKQAPEFREAIPCLSWGNPTCSSCETPR